MSREDELASRSDGLCELCRAADGLAAIEVPPESDGSSDHSIWACTTCREQLAGGHPLDSTHWRCLTDSMWTGVPAVQVTAWRLLRKLRAEAWAADALEM